MKKHTNQNEQHWKLLVLLLRQIAIAKNITASQIAEESDLKESTVNRIFDLQYCPSLRTFLKIAQALKINFFFEDRESTTDLSQIFEAAMTQLGRRPDNLSKN